MPVKILSSRIISLYSFCQNPISSLKKSEGGILAILKNYTPVMYAITPERLAQLLALEVKSMSKNNNMLIENTLIHNKIHTNIYTPVGKYVMYDGWKPDSDFIRQAAVWGIPLTNPITDAELSGFISYWQAEGSLFHHIQWQQKFARNLQIIRANNFDKSKTNITQISNPNLNIPEGFRG
ncbi:primosomal protein DnaT [Candidatus Pantoea edessiphila]|uniref:Primosomal protein DnaT n=1 Tax=Candidatus Pantoea edessiphila TaxID=2044610 RepID=A0A2P5SXA7_9GAMM|nr:primosomal protein DnaT [Candidatus Pantoea edessiphila]MBK4775842.1 primosomal protein DnaT [Pantoea sp. Edef]PPI86969.1 primosomal protein DnaT [Candidatus Pantoea edessiphila]